MTADGLRIAIEFAAIAVSLIAIFLLIEQNRIQLKTSTDNVEAIQQQIAAGSTDTVRQIQAQATSSAEENQTIREQSERQYQQQQQIYFNTQRAELLETIYGRRDCSKPNIDDCAFLLSVRVRAEAVVAFVRILDPENRVQWHYTDRANCKADSVDIDLRNVNLAGANLERIELSGTNLSKAVLNEATLDRATLDNVNLIEAELRHATLWDAKLRCAKLWRIDFSYADLRNAELQDAELNGVTLTFARYDLDTLWPKDFDYQHSKAIGPCADLTNMDLTDADLTNADLHNAILTGTELTIIKAELAGAKYTDDTVWPDGFDYSDAGAIRVESAKCR